MASKKGEEDLSCEFNEQLSSLSMYSSCTEKKPIICKLMHIASASQQGLSRKVASMFVPSSVSAAANRADRRVMDVNDFVSEN